MCHISAIFVLLLLSIFTTIHSQDFSCCSHVTGSCRSACEKISLVQIASDGKLRNQTVAEVKNFCSPQLNTFWECLNATFRDISKGDSWSGRLCCGLPQGETCRKACITATRFHDLIQGCRQSDEIAFFSCIDRQKDGEICCGNARDEECRRSCFNIFRTQLTPTKEERKNVQEHCEANNPQVYECVKEFVKVTPAKNLHKHLHCCDMSPNPECTASCRKILSAKAITLQEVIDRLLLGGCGNPLPQDYFWQCFIKPPDPVTSVEVSRIERVGMDSAKWHCCQRSSSTQCQKLCAKTFTKYWATSWHEFHDKCLSQPTEEALRNCIDEVDEPCELGCDGLSFCTNFNNRPADLFRSCNAQADEAARNDVSEWQHRHQLTLPGLVLPLRNISECSPTIWKAVACTLQIKPCSKHHANQICRDICLDILSQCVDWLELPPSYTPEGICAELSPEDPNASCINLHKFLHPSSQYEKSTQVFSPCKGTPCEPNEVCLIDKDLGSYQCTPGCKLGEVSEYRVPDGTFVRIPINNHQQPTLKICKCNRERIEECLPLPPVSLTPCIMGSSTEIHGSTFQMDCNSCTCFAGEVICSKKQCEDSALGRNVAYTTLPCNCPAHYTPVCGRDGNTYPSACLAKCSGLSDSDIEHQPCEDPCKKNRCPVGHKCVPNNQVCLSLMHKPCKQFQCVNGTADCKLVPKSPVCSIDGTVYDNECLLAHHNKKLDYRGPCLRNCLRKGPVCGANGRTYTSECAAFADSVPVDYQGSCTAVGLITETKSRQCDYIPCAPLPHPDCLGITPPGACCPICGGALRLLYSRKQIDRALYALKDNNAVLTLGAMLKALERQIQVAQCVLRGYVTLEQDIFITVQSTKRNPTELQLETCVREAEKIASLVNMQSPRIVSELSLSSLTLAKVVHTHTNGVARIQLHIAWVLLVILTQLLC